MLSDETTSLADHRFAELSGVLKRSEAGKRPAPSDWAALVAGLAEACASSDTALRSSLLASVAKRQVDEAREQNRQIGLEDGEAIIAADRAACERLLDRHGPDVVSVAVGIWSPGMTPAETIEAAELVVHQHPT